MYSRSSRFAIPDSIAGSIILLVIVLLILAIWLMVKAAELVARVVMLYPQYRRVVLTTLWVCLGLWTATTMTATMHGQSQLTGVLACCALGTTGLLVILAKTIETHADPLFKKPPERLVTSVLGHRWWHPTEGAA